MFTQILNKIVSVKRMTFILCLILCMKSWVIRSSFYEKSDPSCCKRSLALERSQSRIPVTIERINKKPNRLNPINTPSSTKGEPLLRFFSFLNIIRVLILLISILCHFVMINLVYNHLKINQ